MKKKKGKLLISVDMNNQFRLKLLNIHTQDTLEEEISTKIHHRYQYENREYFSSYVCTCELVMNLKTKKKIKKKHWQKIK